MPVIDSEGDGFFPSKFYVLSYYEGGKVHSLTTHEEMKEWLLKQEVLIGHNIIRFDIPHFERVFNIKIKAKLIDTLALSWYLYPERKLHGLEWWGVDFGVPKPVITSWTDLPLEEYVNRCEEDVKINQLLWEKERDYLSLLYETQNVEKLPIISYLMFKMDCAREQEQSKWKLDVEWCKKAYDQLLAEQEPRIAALKAVMPPVKKWTLKERPAKPFKKDGTLSVEGAKWQNLLRQEGLPEDWNQPVRVVSKVEEPNPNSPEQVKDWLFELGWEPITFKFEKEEDGTERKIPQVKLPNSPDLCPSVLELADQQSAIKELEGLSIVKHRLGLLKGFLENVDEEGCLKARVQGFTNTLRFKHTEIVNLPGIDKPYGELIRGCLIARDGYELVGTDMVSLEDTTKKHFMYFHDPDYVIEMSQKGFDPHLDLAVRSGAVSQEDVNLFVKHKNDEDLGDNLSAVIKLIAGLRKTYKVVNYSAVYGVGPPKLARELKTTLGKAKDLLESYWRRNWAVKKVAEECVVKTVNRQKWLYNPVSKFWYSLRNEKDRFSTLNQGTGVYCFDSWVRECRKRRPQITGQFHDETISEVKKGYFEKMKALQLEAIDAVNAKLQLNVTLGIDVKHGHRYSEIH